MLLREFKLIRMRSQDPIRSAFELIEGLDEILTKLSAGEIPNESYTLENLVYFCASLVKRQRKHTVHLKPWSWCLFDRCLHLDSEARVDFAFFPTYYAVSILTLFHKKFPLQARKIKGFQRALKKGYFFATYRRLLGHGFEGEDQREVAMEILRKGRVIEAIREQPNLCPALYEIMFGEHDNFLQGRYFRYFVGEKDVPVHVSGFFVVRPQAEVEIIQIARQVANQTYCSCLLGKQPKAQLGTKKSGDQMFHLHSKSKVEYDNIIGKFQNNSLNNKTERMKQYLSLSLRGMSDTGEMDICIRIPNNANASEKRFAEWVLSGFKYLLPTTTHVIIEALGNTHASNNIMSTLYHEENHSFPCFSLELLMSKSMRVNCTNLLINAISTIISDFLARDWRIDQF